MKKDLSQIISVVIITKDRKESLLNTLRHLANLPEIFPIIVVDNGSLDGTKERVQKEFPNVQIICLKKNLGPVGRNIGVEKATTPLIAFSDDDTWWKAGSLRKAVSYFNEYPKLGLISGKILVRGERIDPVCEIMAKSPLSKNIPVPGPAILGFQGGATVVRKKAFVESGGFSDKFGIGGEESLLAIDIATHGWGLAYMQDIEVFHYPSPVRNPKRRKQLGVRNYLWFVWIRRPIKSALSETSRILQYFFTDINIGKGILEALKGIPWILKNRKVIPYKIEKQLQMLEYFTL